MRGSASGRVQRSLAEWCTLCERFARSGLDVAEFCSREQLTVSSFKVTPAWGLMNLRGLSFGGGFPLPGLFTVVEGS
jgi:hypothetical protein